jgi:2-alkyl-3-oxoalkanoate reductase
MNIFLTGATGFLGGHLAQRLAQEGCRVTAVGRNQKRGAELTQLPNIQFLPLDIRDSTAIQQAVRGHELIIHAAAKSDAWGDPNEFWGINVWGTTNLLRASQMAGVRRFIHISTPSVYFYDQPRLDVREDEPLPNRFMNEYVRTKRAAEILAQTAYQQDGLPVVMLRPRAIFGPGDTSLLPRLLAALAQGRLPVIGTGETWLDLTYVANVVEGVWLAMQAEGGRVHGRVFNLTNGDPINLWDLLRQLAHDLGYPPPRRRLPYPVAWHIATLLEAWHKRFRPQTEPRLTRYAVGVLGQSRTLNISAIQQALGYVPPVSMAEGYERTLATLRQS